MCKWALRVISDRRKQIECGTAETNEPTEDEQRKKERKGRKTNEF